MKTSVLFARALAPGIIGLSILVVGELALAWRDLQSDASGADEVSRIAAATGSVERSVAEDPVARILARPLFTPGRHGAVEARASVATEQKPNEPPRLLGLLISGSKRYAWFDDPNADTPTMVSEGDDIGDFTVESIGRRSLVLSDAKGEDHEVFPRALTGLPGPANPQQARAPAAATPDEQKEDDDKDDDDEPAPAAAPKP
jgi:hypothetical protein